ncbi:Eco57I restriction-modification methylase domain-containing protein [Methylosinus sp. Sm6]|uniref:Eco57I restriction-modification methylase domain-containing protein n=1 Tax=Methylosinus sp. Sm6 TaxID=2866948 RepID=UPI001C9A0393|nr:Eco57I restriction-modification methylase domain-containing protein [Methylosinus sp. Sm6]MBY6244021.1 Eco57I restriction-modification methylase domain-containing protein [Methylosinus sp. Sm6]
MKSARRERLAPELLHHRWGHDHDFLIEGATETEAWSALSPAAIDALRAQALHLFQRLTAQKEPSEAVTEKDLIYPLLAMIGWNDLVFVQPNASAKGRVDVPDALLFGDAASLALAKRESEDFRRFQHGLSVVEAKRWDRPLDREGKGRKDVGGTPSSQMLRYLRRADDITNGKLRWGVLTNGRLWRLYFHGALSVAEDFFEIDLGKALELPGCGFDLLDKRPDAFGDDRAWRDHAFRLFVLFFGRTAFLPSDAGETFHTLALREGKKWEARVAKTLSNTIFNVFQLLADALAKSDPSRPAPITPAYLDELRHGALILLYRLLFVLYAEDRNLLPDESGPYAPYCLTKIRLEIAGRFMAGGSFPQSFVTFWPRLSSIFRAIAQGADDLGIPPYNGGLFDPATAPILSRAQLPDSVIAKVVFELSHQTEPSGSRDPKYINYRDLSVQQLGSVYERILEFGLRVGPDGAVEIDADDEARHESGSYYTPDELVGLIIERAVGPLVLERTAAFKAKAEQLASDKRAAPQRLAELAAVDPATAILSLKVCDPAMGSGHFLVSLVDWLADEVLGSMAEAAALVSFGDYVSPLAARIADIRGRILEEAKAHNWPIVEEQLDDRHVVRRMVLKRVVYGVDKNPMAVELAKVALWLHSFTVGAPLSFLDHHLRAGDSILGAFVRPTIEALKERGALFNLGQVTRVEQIASVMSEIEAITDNDIAEVKASKAKFGAVEDVTEPVAHLFSLLTAERLMGIFDAAPKREPDLRKLAGKSEKQIAKARKDHTAFERAAALQLVLEGACGDPLLIAAGKQRVAAPGMAEQLALLENAPPEQTSLFPSVNINDRRRVEADKIVDGARILEKKHGFLHWEISFPNVWSNLLSVEPEGGFDAVIGNPPYVRQELLSEDVKRALKKSYDAFDEMADLYVYFYEQGLRLLRPGGRLSYVVTNKWLKAGYAEALRDLFASKGWLEFVADFGHAKHFFPDADVFPSVMTVRKPDATIDAPTDAEICVIPRDAVPRKGLAGTVAEATFPLPRAMFTKEAWVLEPRPVMDLLEKIRRNGTPLLEYAGVKPYRGVLTGLNEAFLIDTEKRDELVRGDPACADIIQPYLRGQDIDRWYAPWSGLWMIFARRGIEIDRYPSVKRHLERYRQQLDPKPDNWIPKNSKDKWPGRKEGSYEWYEIQDSTEYWELFLKQKIVYQEIQFHPRYCFDESSSFSNNKTFFIPSSDIVLLSVLNSPIMWWHNWRFLPHMKDEALTPMGFKMERLPIPSFSPEVSAEIRGQTETILGSTRFIAGSTSDVLDWLRHEFGIEKPSQTLAAPAQLNAHAFVDAVRKALPRSRKLSAAEIARLKKEHAQTIEPSRRSANEALSLERRLSDLVNSAYGLTAEEIDLMWRTAPPRMPFTPTN